MAMDMNYIDHNNHNNLMIIFGLYTLALFLIPVSHSDDAEGIYNGRCCMQQNLFYLQQWSDTHIQGVYIILWRHFTQYFYGTSFDIVKGILYIKIHSQYTDNWLTATMMSVKLLYAIKFCPIWISKNLFEN